MAKRKINADIEVTGRMLTEFSGTNYLDSATDIHQALRILDQLVHDQTVRYIEYLTPQINGTATTFQTQHSFSQITVVLNGLVQSEGADADYVLHDNTHIEFYRPLQNNETLRVEYTHV